MKALSTVIEQLGLQAHPEGGWYAETYRSTQTILMGEETRDASTGIYYVLEHGDFSAFHRIDADEGWHHYSGAPLQITILENGRLRVEVVGAVDEGYRPQVWVPAGAWFAAMPLGSKPYGLVGCTVAPGFEFRHFEMADRASLLAEYPEFEEVILQFTRTLV